MMPLFLAAFWLAGTVGAAAAPPRLALTLAQAETAARDHSLELKIAAEESAAAKDGAEAQFSSLLPRLTLDGSYRYQTEVPLFSPVPGGPATRFGDHRATSLGPTLSWTLWDQGGLYKTWRAQKAGAKSAEELERLSESQTILGARLAYVQVQLAREQVGLLADSVALARAQYEDIEKRLRAGSASRIDSLSSHQEELLRRKDFLQAQAGLAASLRELLQLTGLGKGLDLSRPVDIRLSTSLPSGFSAPTVLVELDSLAQVPQALAAAELAPAANPEHPGVMAYEQQAQAARLAADGISAQSWPKIQMQARADYEYPNGPVLQSVTQKSIGLMASVPLFEMGRASHLAGQQSHLAAAAERRRDLASEQLDRDRDKARAALASLRDQQALDENRVAESEELARLVYSAYKAGRSSYIEVQTHNLSAVQAKVQAAQTRAQILVQLAALAQLSAKG